jgi:hypothetical protein
MSKSAAGPQGSFRNTGPTELSPAIGEQAATRPRLSGLVQGPRRAPDPRIVSGINRPIGASAIRWAELRETRFRPGADSSCLHPACDRRKTPAAPGDPRKESRDGLQRETTARESISAGRSVRVTYTARPHARKRASGRGVPRGSPQRETRAARADPLPLCDCEPMRSRYRRSGLVALHHC